MIHQIIFLLITFNNKLYYLIIGITLDINCVVDAGVHFNHYRHNHYCADSTQKNIPILIKSLL